MLFIDGFQNNLFVDASEKIKEEKTVYSSEPSAVNEPANNYYQDSSEYNDDVYNDPGSYSYNNEY